MRRFIPNPQTFVYVSALTSPVIKLNQCRIKVSNNILPAGQQQNLSLPTFLVFLESLTSLLRDASEMQRSGFGGGAGSQHQVDCFSTCLSQCKFSGTEGNAPGDLRPGASGSPSQREILGKEEGIDWRARDGSLTSCPKQSV